jgi:hypothetical protein
MWRQPLQGSSACDIPTQRVRQRHSSGEIRLDYRYSTVIHRPYHQIHPFDQQVSSQSSPLCASSGSLQTTPNRVAPSNFLFLGQSWYLAASLEIFHPTSSNASRGDSTITKILQWLYSTTREQWLSRNRCLHNHSDQVSRDIQSTEATEIRHFHSQPHLLLPIGNQEHYRERSLNELLHSSKAVRRRWLKHIRQARSNKLRHGLLQTRNISHFFVADKTPGIDRPPRGSPSPPSGIGRGSQGAKSVLGKSSDMLLT